MYEDKTEEQVQAEILSRLPPDMAKNEGSFAHLLAAGAASAICRAYHAADGLLGMIYLDEGSGPYIDQQASEVGIIRKPGVKASCTMNVTAKPGTVIPAGTLWYTANGTAFVSTQESVVPESGTITITLEALEPGASGNIGAGMLTSIGHTIPGISKAVNGPATSGVDTESDKALLGRLMAHRARPAVSGNVYHYEMWATAVPGVGAARVLAKHAGPGTVKVVLVGPDMTPVSSDTVRAADKAVQTQKPIGPTVTVVSASKKAIDVTAAITIQPGISKDAVRAQLIAKLSQQLAKTVEAAYRRHVDPDISADDGSYKLMYNFVLAALMGCDGVLDVSDLTVCGKTFNVVIPADHAAVVGTVVVK